MHCHRAVKTCRKLFFQELSVWPVSLRASITILSCQWIMKRIEFAPLAKTFLDSLKRKLWISLNTAKHRLKWMMFGPGIMVIAYLIAPCFITPGRLAVWFSVIVSGLTGSKLVATGHSKKCSRKLTPSLNAPQWTCLLRIQQGILQDHRFSTFEA